MKKRIFAALSAMLMLLALAGCGAKQVDYDATCTISILLRPPFWTIWDACDPDKREQVPQDGVILAPVEVGFQTGENVFDVLQRVCRENRIQMESKWTPLYESAYIQASTTCMNSTWAAAPAGCTASTTGIPTTAAPATRCSG